MLQCFVVIVLFLFVPKKRCPLFNCVTPGKYFLYFHTYYSLYAYLNFIDLIFSDGVLAKICAMFERQVNVPLLRMVFLLFVVCIITALYWVYFNLSTHFHNAMDSFLKDAWDGHFTPASTIVMDDENTNFDKSEKNAPTPTVEPNVLHKTFLAGSRPFMNVLKEHLNGKGSEPLLTLFTTWNENSTKYLVHNLTVRNWLSLRSHVIPVVFTNETSVARECQRLGMNVFPVRKAAANGVPVLKYMYLDVMANYNTTFYAYANGDILFTGSLIETLVSLIHSGRVDHRTKPLMVVGCRTNVERMLESEGSSWQQITRTAKKRGRILSVWTVDYFITTRIYPWKDMAEVVIGRMAYDNWLIAHSRNLKFVVIDATNTILAVHQTRNSSVDEGFQHPNKTYNLGVLKTAYGHVNYGAGKITCAEYYTNYENESLVFSIRDRNALCKNIYL